MAGQMCVHRNSLSWAVTRFAGMTFSNWISNYRLDEVERLAATETLPTGKLARRVGFACRTSFYGSFRKLRGNSPSAYFLLLKHTKQ